MRTISSIARPHGIAALHAAIWILLTACSPAGDEKQDATRRDGPPSGIDTALEGEPATPANTPASTAATAASGVVLRAENVFDHEAYWPNIAALVTPWTPAGATTALKPGYRGAVIRLDERGRVRIDFGRHGDHEVPIAATDFVARAQQVAAGTLHKVAPNWLAHFGTQFVHPTTEELVAFPTPELARSDRFLCVFADPRPAAFAQQAAALAGLADIPKLQALLFPLALAQDQIQAVKDRLREVGWAVPFAYPQAADKLAESLLGEVPTGPIALLVTAEGRVLQRTPLDEPGAIAALRASATAFSPERHNRHDFVQ